MKLHGGQISDYSEGEDKGPTFASNIPIMRVRRQELPPERVHPKAWTEISVERPPEISGLKVLVVDNDSDTCDMIRAVLEQCGGVAMTAIDAESAIDAFRSWKPAVLISDIGLPEVDGYELVRRIREDERPNGLRTP